MAAGVLATQTPDGLSLRLKGGMELIDEAVEALRQGLVRLGRSQALFDVELLAREALLNALCDGAPRSKSGEVRVELAIGPEELRLTVEDDGPGFDWRPLLKGDLPDPGRESGRGLFIMQNYADEVLFNQSGNSLVLVKRFGAEERKMVQDSSTTKTVKMPEKVSAQDVPELREQFKAFILAGVRELELDFGGVRSIDSVGIGLLVATHNSLARVGGVLRVVGASRDIHQLLTLMRLDKHFSIAKGREGA